MEGSSYTEKNKAAYQVLPFPYSTTQTLFKDCSYVGEKVTATVFLSNGCSLPDISENFMLLDSL